MLDEAPNVTPLLLAWSNGDQAPLDSLVPRIYAELHRIAGRYMRRKARIVETRYFAGLTVEETAEALNCRWPPWSVNGEEPAPGSPAN